MLDGIWRLREALSTRGRRVVGLGVALALAVALAAWHRASASPLDPLDDRADEMLWSARYDVLDLGTPTGYAYPEAIYLDPEVCLRLAYDLDDRGEVERVRTLKVEAPVVLGGVLFERGLMLTWDPAEVAYRVEGQP